MLVPAAAEGAAASGKLAGTPEAQAAQAMAQADRTAPPGPSKAPIPRPAPLSRRLISRNSSFVGGLSEDEIEVHSCHFRWLGSCCITDDLCAPCMAKMRLLSHALRIVPNIR